ncbi:MAG: glycosyltransferase [Geobacteraceae bacterium]|nr:glycosyltransferase [Geobacteraceae bacterium]
MRFSIITPTMNSAASLEETIRSVLGQTDVALEYLLIDGGSTDATLDIIKRHAAADDRIRWMSGPDQGIADAFNKGIALAGGDVIGIINSDDLYESGALAAVRDQFQADPDCDLVHGDMLRLEGDQPLFRMVPGPVAETIWREMPLNHPTVFVKAARYQELGGFDVALRLTMDYELVLRYYRAGCRFCYLPRILARMRYGGASDNHFLAVRTELFRVTTAAGYPHWKAAVWFLRYAAAGSIKLLLRRTGLYSLMRLHPKFRPLPGDQP